MTTGQVTLNTSTPTLIVDVEPNRFNCIMNSTAQCFIGNSNAVTAATGFLVQTTVNTKIESVGQIWGIAASGTPIVTFVDQSRAGFPDPTVL